MNNIGFLIDEFGSSQLCYMLLKKTEEIENAIIFYDSMFLSCVPPRVTIMSISEAYAQKGTMVATSIKTANQMINFFGANRKLFYVWDTSWICKDNQILLYNIFNQTEIIARNLEMAKLIENNFNTTVKYITDNFDDIENVIGQS